MTTMTPDYSPLYTPPPERPAYGCGFETALGILTLAWIIAIGYGCAFALHWLIGTL